MSTTTTMKPMIIVPPDTLSAEDVKKLEDNQICVVVAKDPAKVRFMDPIPAVSSRTEIEQAAIRLSRVLLHGQHTATNLSRDSIAAIYTSILIKGTPLDARGSMEEQEKEWADSARRMEIERMAREEARAAREAMKAKEAAAANLSRWKPGDRGRPPKGATVTPPPQTPASPA